MMIRKAKPKDAKRVCKLGKRWNYLETKNFIRYVRPLKRKVAKKDLEKQEKHLKKFCNNFKIKNKQKITIYTVKDRKEMKSLVGYETNGRAESDHNRIFSVYVYCPHEVIHIISDNYLGDPNNLLGEGLAVCFGWKEGWHGKSLKYWMKKFIKSKKYIPLKTLLDDFIFKKNLEDNITYPESGAFTKFLMANFELRKIKLLYKSIKWKQPVEQNIKIFEKVLKTKFKTLEEKFIKHYS